MTEAQIYNDENGALHVEGVASAAELARAYAKIAQLEAARIPAPAPDEVERLRYALQRIARLTPGRANAATAMDLHHTVAAIAETALSAIPIPAPTGEVEETGKNKVGSSILADKWLEG